MNNNKQQDPEWIKQITKEISKEKFDKENKLFKETFLEYLAEGYSPMDALAKAKKIVSAFSGNK